MDDADLIAALDIIIDRSIREHWSADDLRQALADLTA